ncbi:uncharacterized protein LOC144114977 isoform X2 [Amblyomma americanum]
MTESREEMDEYILGPRHRGVVVHPPKRPTCLAQDKVRNVKGLWMLARQATTDELLDSIAECGGEEEIEKLRKENEELRQLNMKLQNQLLRFLSADALPEPAPSVAMAAASAHLHLWHQHLQQIPLWPRHSRLLPIHPWPPLGHHQAPFL